MESEDLLEACPSWLIIVLGLALETGFRRGELLILKRSDLHYDQGENGIISLREEETKTQKSKHTVESGLVQREVPLYVVSQILGHSSLETTKRYAHLAPEHLAAGMEALGKSPQKGLKIDTIKESAIL